MVIFEAIVTDAPAEFIPTGVISIIILRVTVRWGLQCGGGYSAVGGTVRWGLQCGGGYSAVGGAVRWGLKCLEQEMEAMFDIIIEFIRRVHRILPRVRTRRCQLLHLHYS